MTHYAPRLADGGPDRKHHGLENADEFLQVCNHAERGAILCGHIHRGYCVRLDDLTPPIFCAGSATYEGRENVWVFDIDGDGVRATPGRWKDDRYVLVTDEAITI